MSHPLGLKAEETSPNKCLSYLYGDIPGATIDAITIEAHSNHTLQIYGKTQRLGVALPLQDQEPESSTSNNDFVKVNVEDASHPPSSDHKEVIPTSGPNATTHPSPIQGQVPYYPPPPTQQITQGHPHHERHRTFSTSKSNAQQYQNQGPNPSHRVLLSERLVGDFHRTFAFPAPVVEDGVRATLENGVLSLVVPKKDAGTEERKGRRVPIEKGRSYGGH